MRIDGVQYIVKGARMYHKLYKQEKDEILIVCPCGIGDTICIASLVASYKEKLLIEQHKKGHVVLVVKKGHANIPDMFPSVDGKIVISSIEMRGLYLFMTIFRLYNRKGIRYGFFHRSIWGRILHSNPMKGFIYDYKTMVLGLDEKCQLENAKINCMKMEKDLSNSVLIAPYAYSLDSVDIDFYNELTLQLKKIGVTVYTNVQGINEKCIDLTEPFISSINELLEVASQFRCIIATRSGICDALALTNCKLRIIYPNEAYGIKSTQYVIDDFIVDDVRLLNLNGNIKNYMYINSERINLMKSLVAECVE